jgi:hypothetical protein
VKIVLYAGGEYLTGDEIADALVLYSQVLAQAGTAESVEVPIREPNGDTTSAVFLVGPASQLVVKQAPTDGDELVDDGVVELLKSRVRRLQPSNPDTMPDYWL